MWIPGGHFLIGLYSFSPAACYVCSDTGNSNNCTEPDDMYLLPCPGIDDDTHSCFVSYNYIVIKRFGFDQVLFILCMFFSPMARSCYMHTMDETVKTACIVHVHPKELF